MRFFDLIVALAIVSALLSAIMAGAWLAWRSSGNSGWIDTVWTFGLGATGAVGALLPLAGATPRQWMVVAMVLAWSARLGAHIAHRTSGITDDPRYAKLAQGWGADANRQMFWPLQKQALVSIPLALAVVLAAHHPAPALRAQDWLGLAVLAVAIAGEAAADSQLRRFRSDPSNKGRVCDVGLWGWSRHPNYFFEWFGWLAYAVIAIDVTGAYPLGWLALAGPACIYWLLVYVSGIPPLEEHMLAARGEAFRAYQARTSAFFPMPPRTS